ncbi:hypothetical protein J4221_03755 [Candidatus Pacearchaeota archaeon]|nr:hypothetical protein [Candidatus Pacearchaeota archaeon]
MKNKKSESFLIEQLVFILLTLVFVVAIGIFIVRTGDNTAFIEQIYAKQLALIINKAEAGMESEIDITRLLNLAQKNKFNGNIITIDNNENKVNIKLTQGSGYEYYFFNDNNIVWNVNKEERKLILNFVKLEDE